MKIATSVLVENSKKEFLLLRESDPRVSGKLNLPGGHLEDNESIIDCAKRELFEETGLKSEIDYLIGIYQLPVGMHFVFHANNPNDLKCKCGDDILSAHRMNLDTINQLKDNDVLRYQKLKMIIQDYLSGNQLPISTIKTVPHESWEVL